MICKLCGWQSPSEFYDNTSLFNWLTDFLSHLYDMNDGVHAELAFQYASSNDKNVLKKYLIFEKGG